MMNNRMKTEPSNNGDDDDDYDNNNKTSLKDMKCGGERRVMEKEGAGPTDLDNILPRQLPCPEKSEDHNLARVNSENVNVIRTPKRKFCEVGQNRKTADDISKSVVSSAYKKSTKPNQEEGRFTKQLRK